MANNRNPSKLNHTYSLAFMSELENKIGKQPSSPSSGYANQDSKPSINPGDLPPSDEPPPFPTDQELFGEEGCKILLRIDARLKEFLTAGEILSEKCTIVPDFLEAKLSNLGNTKVSLLPDNGLALTIFIHQVINSVTILSILNNPFPHISEKINEKSVLSFSDILYTFNFLRVCIVNPEYNSDFKNRAVQCSLLTLAYEKLRKSPLDISDIDNELIASMQRLTRLCLFANDALKEFICLRNCKGIGAYYQGEIDMVISNLKDLLGRSQLIGIAVNDILTAIGNVAVRSPEYKRYSSDAVKLLETTMIFVNKIVTSIMEDPFQNLELFSEQIKAKINQEYTANLSTNFITPSDNLYYDLSILLSQSKSERKNEINQLINIDLRIIHENESLGEADKLSLMKKKITDTYNNLATSLNTSTYFYARTSKFADDLLGFIKKEMNKYTILPCKASNDHIQIKPKNFG